MVKKLEVGTVFIVPTGDGRAGVGQVVATFGANEYHFAVFDGVLPLVDAAKRSGELLDAPVLFLALSLDAKLHVGHWTVVGNAPVAPSIVFPVYKVAVGSPDNIEVVDYSGTRRRAASMIEANVLPSRSTVAPVRFERALRAWLGLEPWNEAFDDLRPEGRITTADIFD